VCCAGHECAAGAARGAGEGGAVSAGTFDPPVCVCLVCPAVRLSTGGCAWCVASHLCALRRAALSPRWSKDGTIQIPVLLSTGEVSNPSFRRRATFRARLGFSQSHAFHFRQAGFSKRVILHGLGDGGSSAKVLSCCFGWVNLATLTPAGPYLCPHLNLHPGATSGRQSPGPGDAVHGHRDAHRVRAGGGSGGGGSGACALSFSPSLAVCHCTVARRSWGPRLTSLSRTACGHCLAIAHTRRVRVLLRKRAARIHTHTHTHTHTHVIQVPAGHRRQGAKRATRSHP